MKVLFIGGTGVISSDAASLAASRGMDVTVLTRGRSMMLPVGVRYLRADIRNKVEAEKALENKAFDVIVDCITFTPEEMRSKLELLRGKYKQLIYISSIAVYQVDAPNPVREDVTPIGNPHWDYGRGKAACEAELERDHLFNGSNYTVVRPCETYNDMRLPGVFVADPHRGGYTILNRLRKGLPIPVLDDGGTLCPFLHSADMARALVGLFMNEDAFGQCFHITSDELHSWREVTEMEANAVGVKPNIIYVPWLELAREVPRSPLGDTYGVLDEKRFDHSYDNSKIKAAVPDFRNTITLYEGIKRVVTYYENHPEFQTIDEELDEMLTHVCVKRVGL